MDKTVDRDQYDIEKQIYMTQWTNIRHHWTQTFAGITLLLTLVTFAVVPIQLLHNESTVITTNPYIKYYIAAMVFLFGFITLLNQLNHYMRSREARKVVVAIEHKWGLYDKDDRFIFQDNKSKYAFSKFAGGEKRLTYSKVQFGYIIVITIVALSLILFA